MGRLGTTTAANRGSKIEVKHNHSNSKQVALKSATSAKVSKSKTELKLVEVRGQRLITTSLLIADKFGKSHKFVLKKIDRLQCSSEFHRANFAPSIYVAANGKDEKCYNVTEEGFMFIAMSFTGIEAMRWKEAFIIAFQKMRIILNEPGRNIELQYKRDTAIELTDTVKFIRETEGKETKPCHYSIEHKFCNRALTGRWESIIDSELDSYDLRLLSAIRRHNSLLMTRYPKQADRKAPLDNFVDQYKAKHPRSVALVGANG
ncbi:MAG: Rha family transcriptional regulator [Methylobacter sp.]|nr:Rha family transcriptional regulator [Methylobacter sp.]